jgi:flagellar basal-body rod modification protein FlgD
MNIQQLTSTPATGNAAPTSGASSAATPTVTSVANSSESAFLQLLVTELQSQDPTSPMDPTQMVGQMLSMNQLNELISINQTLQAVLGLTSGNSAPTTGAAPTTQSTTGAH